MHAIYSHTENTYIHKNESKHSEMGPVRQNLIQRTVSLFICVCIALCTIVAHNIAQNRPDNFPSYHPDTDRKQCITKYRHVGFIRPNHNPVRSRRCSKFLFSSVL